MNNSVFFILLRDALWGTQKGVQLEISAKDAEQLFQLAERQAVSGLVVGSLIRHNTKIPQQWVFESVGLIEQIKQQNRIVNEGVGRLNALMAEGGISYVIVKGQVVAQYYTEPLLRQSGDVDFYCDENYFPLMQETVEKKWKVDTSKGKAIIHIHFDYHDVTFEGHFLLVNLYGKKRNLYWQKLLNNDKGAVIKIQGDSIPTLTPTLHVLYVFIHLYEHLMSLGIGLRQFCDLAVMLRSTRTQIDKNVLREHLNRLSLEKAYRACGSILVDYLGLTEEELAFRIEDRDRHYGRKIMDVVMYRGNMGHYNKRSGFSGWKHKVEAAGIKISHFAKFVPLTPSYSCGWLWHEIKRNIL